MLREDTLFVRDVALAEKIIADTPYNLLNGFGGDAVAASKPTGG